MTYPEDGDNRMHRITKNSRLALGLWALALALFLGRIGFDHNRHGDRINSP